MQGDQALPLAFSTQQGSHGISVIPRRDLKRSRTAYGDLELGVTPSLKRSMSTVKFRPPFKALV